MSREHSRFGIYAGVPAILRRRFPPVFGGLAYIDTASALTPMQYVLTFGADGRYYVLCTRRDGASWTIPVETAPPCDHTADTKLHVFQHISARGSCIALLFEVDNHNDTMRISALEIDCYRWMIDSPAPLIIANVALNHGKLPRNSLAMIASTGPIDLFAPQILLLNILTGRRDWYVIGSETAKWRLRPAIGSWILRREYAAAAFGADAVMALDERREYITCTQGDRRSYLLS